MNKEAKRPFKKRLDQRRRDLQKVEDSLSHQEHLLGLGQSQDSLVESPCRTGPDVIVEKETVEDMAEGNAPSVSAMQELAATPPGEEAAQAMDTDPPPTSPVSPMRMTFCLVPLWQVWRQRWPPLRSPSHQKDKKAIMRKPPSRRLLAPT